MTKPWPLKTSWNASPEPRPISALAPAVRRTLVVSDVDQATAAWTSAYVGASTLSTTGVPCEVIATVPVPVNVVLKTPPAIIDAPSTRLMSHVSVESKARTLLPLTVSVSFSRFTRWISMASSAKKTSPWPETLTGEGLLEELPHSAGALVGEIDLALVGDHRSLARHHLTVERHPQHAGVLQREALGSSRLEVRAEQVAAHVTPSNMPSVRPVTADGHAPLALDAAERDTRGHVSSGDEGSTSPTLLAWPTSSWASSRSSPDAPCSSQGSSCCVS